MNEKALVVDGEVVQTGLPRSLKNRAGEWISNADIMPEGMLRDAGWFPLVSNPPEYDVELYTIRSQGYEVNTENVQRTYELQPLPPRLKVDKYTLLSDETDKVTATYLDANGPITVEFMVNGTAETVTMENGRAVLEVFASSPGSIMIECFEHSETIYAVEAN